MNDNIKTLLAKIDELETSISVTHEDFLTRINELKVELTSLRKIAGVESLNQQQAINVKPAYTAPQTPIVNDTPSQSEIPRTVTAPDKQQAPEPVLTATDEQTNASQVSPRSK